MKHPALVRVFAIVLVIMCFVTLSAGGVGMASCFKDKAQQDSDLELMKTRTHDAEELLAILTKGRDYKAQSSEFDSDKELHDTDASQHRTDLATYSATKGGTKMGADKLWEAKAQADGAKAQLESALKQINAGYTQLAGIQGLAGACSSSAGEVGAAIAALTTASTDAQAAAAAVTEAAANAAVEALLAEKPTATDDEKKAAGDAAALAVQTDAALAAAAKMLAGKTAAEAAMPNSAGYNTVKNNSVAALAGLAATAGTAFDPSRFSADINVSIALEDMEGTMTRLYTAQGILGGLGSGLSAAAGAIQTQLDTAKAAADEGMAKLQSGEQEIQSNLEYIWWQNGELEKDAVELEEKKAELEAQSQALAEQEAAAEERKENERKYNSLCTLLKKNDNIKSAVDSGESIIDSARTEITRLTEINRQTFLFRLAICALSIVSGLLGFFVLPAAFESRKSRTLLLLPALLSFLCAAGALGLSLYIGRGVMYSVLFLLPFALIYLLAAIPKKA